MTSFVLICWLGATTLPIESLIEQGRFEDAQERIDTLEPQSRSRFEGLLALQQERYPDAISAFEKALLHSPKDIQLHLYLAHLWMRMEKPRRALKHTEEAATLEKAVVAQPLLQARALMALGDDARAFSVLQKARENFSADSRPPLELAALTHRLGLLSAARDYAEAMLSLSLGKDEALALFHILYEDPKAKGLLERIVALFPNDTEMRAHLAHTYADQGYQYSAARLFREASRSRTDFSFEEADQYRLAKAFNRSLQANSRIANKNQRLSQRVSILFEEGRYAHIVALTPPEKSPLMRYQLAYSYYRVGQHNRASDLARRLLDSPYRDAALSILEAMGRDPRVP